MPSAFGRCCGPDSSADGSYRISHLPLSSSSSSSTKSSVPTHCWTAAVILFVLQLKRFPVVSFHPSVINQILITLLLPLIQFFPRPARSLNFQQKQAPGSKVKAKWSVLNMLWPLREWSYLPRICTLVSIGKSDPNSSLVLAAVAYHPVEVFSCQLRSKGLFVLWVTIYTVRWPASMHVCAQMHVSKTQFPALLQESQKAWSRLCHSLQDTSSLRGTFFGRGSAVFLPQSSGPGHTRSVWFSTQWCNAADCQRLRNSLSPSIWNNLLVNKVSHVQSF